MEEIKRLLENDLIREIISKKFGELGVEVIKKLIENKEMIDLMLASELKVESNVLRAVLYKMYDYRILDFKGRRKKDVAWIDYIWWVREKELVNFLKKELEARRKYILDLIEKISLTEYFYCPKCKNIFNYDLAIKLDFVCPKDKVDLVYLENKEILIEDYKKELSKIEEALALIKSLEVKVKAKSQ